MEPGNQSRQTDRFIDKITWIIRENFTNEQFSVEVLAQLGGCSRSQLYKRIKKATGKSTNQFIREIRLEEAYELLKREEGSVSEIGYRVGFNSPAYFASCFKERYGYPPGEAKHHGNEEVVPAGSTASGHKKRNLFLAALFVLAISLGIIISGTRKGPDPGKIATIAVLPFDDLSSEGDNEWFCAGITEDIHNQLSGLNQIRTISRTSTEHLKSTNQSLSEIAKELGISYFLEGSVRKYDNQVIVTTQLINADDKQLWSETYKDEFKAIFRIQNKVAGRIVELLNITISSEEEDFLTSIPTANIDAYKLVLKGRHLLKDFKGSNEDAIDFFEEALLLDPNYSDAYADIAYAQLNQFLSSERKDSAALTLCKENLRSALMLNPNSSRAYNTQAVLYDVVENNTKKAAESFEKALDLNPNNAETHYEYALFAKESNPPDLKKYLKHAIIASELDPLSNILSVEKFDAYLENRKLDEAEKWYEEGFHLMTPFDTTSVRAKIETYKYNDRVKTVEVYLAALEKDSLNTSYLQILGGNYDIIMNDDQKAVECLAKAYAIDKKFLYHYISLLCENGDFERAWEIIQTDEFKTYRNRSLQLAWIFNYYYEKKEFQKALEISNDSLMQSFNFERALIRATLGMRDELNFILKYQALSPLEKATVFAILQERDSMYYYLNKPGISLAVNSRHEFDPYRNEKRYREFQRKNMIPTQQELDGLAQK